MEGDKYQWKVTEYSDTLKQVKVKEYSEYSELD